MKIGILQISCIILILAIIIFYMFTLQTKNNIYFEDGHTDCCAVRYMYGNAILFYCTSGNEYGNQEFIASGICD
jgi:hypothetical protein